MFSSNVLQVNGCNFEFLMILMTAGVLMPQIGGFVQNHRKAGNLSFTQETQQTRVTITFVLFTSLNWCETLYHSLISLQLVLVFFSLLNLYTVRTLTSTILTENLMLFTEKSFSVVTWKTFPVKMIFFFSQSAKQETEFLDSLLMDCKISWEVCLYSQEGTSLSV